MTDGMLFAEHSKPREIAPGGLARVAVERGIDRLDGEPTLLYRSDDIRLAPGMTVEVPLGRGDKLTRGVVIQVGGAELLAGLDIRKVRAIATAGQTKLPTGLLSLAAWMSEYYVCPLGMVFAAMLPASVKQGIGRRTVEVVSPAGPDVAAALAGTAPLSRTRQSTFDKVRGLDPAMFPMELKDLASHIGVKSTGGLRALIESGHLVSSRESRVRAGSAHVGALGMPIAEGIRPTAAQSAIIDEIGRSLGNFGVHLLRGVTGSGKTEVYLRLIEATLRSGGSAIVLVPEIALTPQTTERFTARFGGSDVAVLHSGLSAARRHAEWARAAAGNARVVVGARSAVFAPLERPTLIIVDEEHDSSYKQDRLPRYNARDVAIKRGQLEGACVVLGSATPSLESWRNASPGGNGAFKLHELTERVGGASLPRVETVDMRDERRVRAKAMGRDDGRLHLLGPTLEAALEHTLAEKGQAILLLNRRGFAHTISCRATVCGYEVSCDQCDARLVLHKHHAVPAGELVRCHHCAAERVVPKLCPLCAGALSIFGGGTQRAEDELLSKFASMGLEIGQTLLRLDSDSMRSASDYFDALASFGRGEARVLVGTQMIAKGLDFPNVRLVGVVDADTALNIPDFRSAERTFQLVSQVAGRAGRSTLPGRVIIQTWNPDLPAIRLAAEHDYVTFARGELAIRERASLPPVSRMARVIVRDESVQEAERLARSMGETLRAAASAGVRVLGPVPCTIARVANQYRFAIDIWAPRAGLVQATLASARQAGLLKSDARTAIDVDPVALL